MQDVANSRVCNICVYLNSQLDGGGDGGGGDVAREIKLHTCQGCLLVVYCGSKHQRIDWPLHREFCRAVQIIRKKNNYRHPLDLIDAAGPQNAEQLEIAILNLKWHLRAQLRRSLRYEEEEWTTYPAYCAICYKKNQMLSTCQVCHGVSWCSAAHAHLVAIQHRNTCAPLSFYYAVHKTQATSATLATARFCCAVKLERLQLCEAYAYSTRQHVPTLAQAAKTLAAYQQFSAMADYSCMATICYALACWRRKKSVGMLQQTHKYIIYIVGATMEHLLWFKATHTQFFFLHNDHFTDLHLYFIGPELVQQHANDDEDVGDDDDEEEIVTKSYTYEFNQQQRQVHYHSYRGSYEDISATHAHLPAPMLIVIYNCGFSEYADGGSWAAGIDALLSTGAVPILFTSYSAVEAAEDQRAVQTNSTKKIVQQILPIHVNPYRDPRPLRSPRCTDETQFYYRNGYVQAVLPIVDHNTSA